MMRVNNASDGITTFVFAIYKMAAQFTIPVENFGPNTAQLELARAENSGFSMIIRPELQHHFLFSSPAGYLGDVHVLPYLRF